MVNSIIKWGLMCGGVMTLFLFVPYFLFFNDGPQNFVAAEIAGYVGMVAALLVIVLAINTHFKGADQSVTIWQRLVLGLGVTFIGGLIFGLANNVYSFWINPEFTDAYFDYYIAQLPTQEGPEYQKSVADLQAQREMFGSPFMSFLVMAATVWMIGIVISIVAGIGHWYFTRRNARAKA